MGVPGVFGVMLELSVGFRSFFREVVGCRSFFAVMGEVSGCSRSFCSDVGVEWGVQKFFLEKWVLSVVC